MTDENAKENATDEQAGEPTGEAPDAASELEERPAASRDDDDESAVPTQLGATRYVLAAFFAGGMAVAFLVSKILTAGWNRLADNAWVSAHMPFMSRIAEDDRMSYTMLIGALVGVFAAVYAYRREDVRTWTNEVAAELAKVTWPTKKEVTNSTMVVIFTSAFATVFLALLDRFWGFVTNLVYGS